MVRDPAARDAAEGGRERRVARLQRVLIDAQDEHERARAHLDLARICLADGQVEGSVRHLREALLLDRRLEAARHLLSELGETSRVQVQERDRRTAVRALLGRFRRG